MVLPRSSLLAPRSCRGFTLIEMIMVIMITGIIGSMVAVFLKAPVQQYLDVSRRSDLLDIADTALYKLAGDISVAVPNSLRVAVSGVSQCIEFLPTKEVGRYRALTDNRTASAVGNILNFAASAPADSSFDIIGPPISFALGDFIVVGSTQSNGAPAYDQTAASGVLRAYAGATGAQSGVTFAAVKFPVFAQLPSQRFEVVDGAQQAVTYECRGTQGALDAQNNGQAQLVKHWAYGFSSIQNAPPVGGQTAILANNVSGCVIDYAPANQRMGLLGIRLTLTSGGESVSLYQEIHVSNAP